MTSYIARIERSNRKDLQQVEVQVTTRELAGRSSWSGEFVSRTTDAIMPDERLALTLDTGQSGTARVTQTYFDSRKPETTQVHIAGTSPLA